MLKVAGGVADPALAKRLRAQAKSLLSAGQRESDYPCRGPIVGNVGVHGESDWGQTMESDISYFRRRCSEERTAALQSRDPKTRKSHLELAERYEDLVRGMSTHGINVDPSDHVCAAGVTDEPAQLASR